MAAIRVSLKRDLDADFGDVIYFSKVMEPRHEFLTANNQTPYVLTFFDLRRGPMVLEVPPATHKVAFFGSAIDSWEVPLADIGPSGDDAGKGGRYLFVPPGFSDTSQARRVPLAIMARMPCRRMRSRAATSATVKSSSLTGATLPRGDGLAGTLQERGLNSGRVA